MEPCYEQALGLSALYELTHLTLYGITMNVSSVIEAISIDLKENNNIRGHPSH